MPVVMRMEWPEVTVEQYEEARRIVHWEQDLPPGGIFHVAFFDEGGFKVVDVWETAEDFQTFVDTRLKPGVEQIGIEGEPKIEIVPAHAVWNPAALVQA
jgi:hypothetical protein